MKILIAPDSFKHSLSATRVAEVIAAAVQKVFPEAETELVPMADGGEGTVEALLNSTGGKRVEVEVNDPLMRKIKSSFGLLENQETAIIEMAAASGIELLQEDEYDPEKTTTYGTGELIRQALEHQVKRIVVGIGGSATNDGGAGMAAALGFRLLNQHGNEVEGTGGNLQRILRIEEGQIPLNLSKTEILIAADVENPLTGKDGATYTYGPQKGAGEKQLAQLEQNMKHWEKLLQDFSGRQIGKEPGAGAAGGLGAGLMAFCNAKRQSGFALIAELAGLKEKIAKADLVVTGEGKIDGQTRFGKTPFGVYQLAKAQHKPVVMFCGTLQQDYKLWAPDELPIFSIISAPGNLQEILQQSSENLMLAAMHAFQMFKKGMLFRV